MPCFRVSFRFATYEKRGRIAYITLNRPEVMNALHLEAHLELKEIWEDFRDDPELRCRADLIHEGFRSGMQERHKA